MRDFRTLSVWQKSHRLTLECYRVTSAFPRDEAFGLTSQMRRAAVSVGSNIAEGCGRDSSADFARFLHMAMGSASELEYHFLLGHDLVLIGDEDYARLSEGIGEVKKMLAGLIQRLGREG